MTPQLPQYSNLGVEQPLEIKKGADLSLTLSAKIGTFDGEDYDLTGCTATARLFAAATPGTTVALFTCAISSPASSGVFTASLSDTQTNALTATPTSKLAVPNYGWDCSVTLSDGTVVPFAHGPVRVVA